jgi:glutamine synthetase
MVKSIAEEHDLRATFMPKPFAHLTGNGCHTHVSIWDKTGKKNLFEDKKGPLGMSQLSHHFIGGILNAAQGLSSIFNPTVNSYKRLNAGTTASGATWAPNAITFGGNNRTTMVRIPGPGRFELRSMDGAANPYLMQAGTLMAGLEGVSSKRDPGKCHDIDMFAEGHKVRGIRKLPLNLLDAIRATEKDKVINEGFGKSFVQSYTKLKRQEWQSYTSHLSQWERDNSLDC